MLAPGAAIGILGGGQLGRMLALAAAELGFKTHIYAPESSPCAADIAAQHFCAAYDDEQALKQFASSVEVITFEFENIPLKTAAFLSQLKPFMPSMRALQTAQDRLTEKNFFNQIGLATTVFAEPDHADDFPLPAIVKKRRMGYDGKGQIPVETKQEIKKALDALNTPAIIEQRVEFSREIAVIAARSQEGDIVFYDPIETRHRAAILREAIAPAQNSEALHDKAFDITRKIAESLDYVGVLAVEMFEVDGSLLVNEMAPRVHNSGHWTKDACAISQFTQHIRAIAGWPLGATTRFADAVMVNLIGDDIHDWPQTAQKPDIAVHIYNKGEARQGRKMGHITRLFPLGAGETAAGAAASSSR